MKKKGGKKRVYIRKGTNDTNAAAAIMISLSNDHHLPYQNDSFHGPRLADRGCHPQWSDGKRGEYDRNNAREISSGRQIVESLVIGLFTFRDEFGLRLAYS